MSNEQSKQIEEFMLSQCIFKERALALHTLIGNIDILGARASGPQRAGRPCSQHKRFTKKVS